MLIHLPILRNATIYPDREAVRTADQRFTWREFAQRVLHIAKSLQQRGLRPGDRFCVLSGNHPSYLEIYYALPMIGAIIVPLNTRLSAPELRLILENCEPWGMAVGDTMLEIHHRLSFACPPPDKTFVIGASGDPGEFSQFEDLTRSTESVTDNPLVPLEELQDDRLVGIFYTGGTTATPKGVCLTHKNLTAHAYELQATLRLRSTDRYLHMAPMFHIADLASTFIITQVGGAHHFAAGFEPSQFADQVEAERVTCTLMVPTMLNILVQWLEKNPRDLSRFRQFLYGGSAIPADRLERALKVLPCKFFQGYGMTESSPTLSVLSDEDHRQGGMLLESAGRPLLGVQIRIVDNKGQPVAPGHVGEIQARAPNIMAGYWRNEEATKKAIVDGWYKSGDLGRMNDEGYLFLLDRLKDKIVSGGENIYSTEVEAILYQNADVVEACVVSAPDETWGERVVAVVVKRGESDLDQEKLKEFCRGRIADFKVPKDIHFRAELPKSGPGKFLKREIREEFWSGKSRRVN